MEIGTPQAWRDDLEWLAAERDARAWIELPERPEPAVAIFAAAKAAVAARDREVAATLRAKIEALQDGLRFGDVRREAVLAVLDAVLGGDS